MCEWAMMRLRPRRSLVSETVTIGWNRLVPFKHTIRVFRTHCSHCDGDLDVWLLLEVGRREGNTSRVFSREADKN